MMDDELCGYDRAARALEHIRRAAGNLEPRVAVVLGSGLGSVADEVEDARILPAAEIPGWPRSTAPGHAGRVVMGTLEGCPVILLQGRVHCYEGYSMQDVTFPVRVLGMMGVRQYVATNASGGVNPELVPGDIAAVRDHINLMGANPLVGPSEPRWNVRFPDMTHAYSPRLLELLDMAAAGAGLTLKRGVYAAFMGPSYETPAEVRMARTLGADLVGMSTVPEVVVANAMGMETAVLSCVANRASGMGDEHLTEEEVLRVMAESSRSLALLIRGLLRALASGGR